MKPERTILRGIEIMKFTAKGNSAWLVLTTEDGLTNTVRTRDIAAVQGRRDSSTDILVKNIMVRVKENHRDILRALEVNLPETDREVQPEEIQEG